MLLSYFEKRYYLNAYSERTKFVRWVFHRQVGNIWLLM
jgi:hypothetical protein